MTARTLSRRICVALATTLAVVAVAADAQASVVSADLAEQADAIGDAVHLRSTFCPGVLDCGVGEDAAPPPAGTGVQHLVAWLLPDAVAAPPTAVAHDVDGDHRLARAPSLDHVRPAPPGRRWVGYASDVVAAAPGAWAAAIDVAVARGPGGLPQPATLTRAVMGATRWATAADAARPVDCAAPDTWCGPTSAEGGVALADLRGAGATVTATAGTTAHVPVTLRAVGAPGPVYALGATTTVPGATAVASQATLGPLAPGYADLDVQVAVPAATAPGAYEVALVASVDGQERRAVGTLLVRAAPVHGLVLVPADDAAPEPEADVGVEVEEEDVFAADADLAPPRWVELRGALEAKRAAGGLDVGTVRCHKPAGFCAWVLVRLLVHGGPRAGMVVAGRAYLVVPAGESRRAIVTLTLLGRRLLRAGAARDALVVLRSAPGRRPVVHRLRATWRD